MLLILPLTPGVCPQQDADIITSTLKISIRDGMMSFAKVRLHFLPKLCLFLMIYFFLELFSGDLSEL